MARRMVKGLTRRPCKGAPAKDVEMQVLHSLTSVGAHVSHDAITIFCQPGIFGHLAAHPQEVANHMSIFPSCSVQTLERLAWNHQ